MGIVRSWARNRALLFRLLTLVGSFASVLSLIAWFHPPVSSIPGWAKLLFFVGIGGFLILVCYEVYKSRGHRIFSKDDIQGIRNYMHHWICNGGPVAIWTRDMTWADTPATQDLLRRKASKGELILCMPEANALALELADAGAELCPYGQEGFDRPATRFTITNWGKHGARLAVGRPEGDNHLIDEYYASSDPAFHIANDLILLAKSLQKNADGLNQ